MLRELDGRQARPGEQTVLAEVLALRTILLNAIYRLAEGEKLTAEEMREFIERADAGKAKEAAERLAGKTSSQRKKTERHGSANTSNHAQIRKR